jgi:hypothetical protein
LGKHGIGTEFRQRTLGQFRDQPVLGVIAVPFLARFPEKNAPIRFCSERSTRIRLRAEFLPDGNDHRQILSNLLEANDFKFAVI